MAIEPATFQIDPNLRHPEEPEIQAFERGLSTGMKGILEQPNPRLLTATIEDKRSFADLLKAAPATHTIRPIESEGSLSLLKDYPLHIDHTICVRGELLLKGAQVKIADGVTITASRVTIVSLSKVFGLDRVNAQERHTVEIPEDSVLEFLKWGMDAR